MDDLPLTCSLESAAMPDRTEAWRSLLADHLVERSRLPGALRLSFSLSAQERLQELIALESECCGWMRFTPSKRQDLIVVDVSSNASGGLALIEEMFAGRRR